MTDRKVKKKPNYLNDPQNTSMLISGGVQAILQGGKHPITPYP